MGETITDFEAFLDAAGPENARERQSLHDAVAHQEDSAPYTPARGRNGQLFIKASHGDVTLRLASKKAEKAFVARLRQDLSEPGASFEGDAAFEYAMSKND